MSCARSASRAGSVGFGVPLGDAVADLVQPAQCRSGRGWTCRRPASAREPREEPGEVHDAGPLVGDDHRPGADVGAGLAQRVELVRGVEEVRRAGGRRSARPRGRALSARLAGAAGEPHRARAGACPAGPRRCRRPRGRAAGRGSCRGWPRRRSRRMPRAPLTMIHGTAARVWTLLTTVGLSNSPLLGGVRRALLGLAALALERLDEDRLLAQHVGALDRADRHAQAVAGPRARPRPGSPPPRPRATAPSSIVTSAGSSARTAMIASVAPIAKAAIARPSMTAYGSAASRAASAWTAGSAP